MRIAWIVVAMVLWGVAAAAAQGPSPTTPGSNYPKGFRTAADDVRCGTKGKTLVCIAVNKNQAGACKGGFTGKGRVRRTGRSVLDQGCFGGLPYDVSGFKVLKKGRKVTRKGVTCKAGKASVRCTNRSRHGFVLSRAGASSF